MGVAERWEPAGAGRRPGLQTWPAAPALPRRPLQPSRQEAASSRSLLVKFWRIVGAGNIWPGSKEHNKKRERERARGWGGGGREVRKSHLIPLCGDKGAGAAETLLLTPDSSRAGDVSGKLWGSGRWCSTRECEGPQAGSWPGWDGDELCRLPEGAKRVWAAGGPLLWTYGVVWSPTPDPAPPLAGGEPPDSPQKVRCFSAPLWAPVPGAGDYPAFPSLFCSALHALVMGGAPRPGKVPWACSALRAVCCRRAPAPALRSVCPAAWGWGHVPHRVPSSWLPRE